MVDLNKIKNEYIRLKSASLTRLLPIEKIIQLENEKEKISTEYLSKIKAIDEKFEIISENGFKIDDLLKIAKTKFGDLNFFDTNNEENKISIDMAFHFCIISISYFNQKIKYRITIFWDV
jgi:hypothetical protein